MKSIHTERGILQAYILTASSEDHNSKHYLRYFGRCELGPFEFIVTDFKPYMYIEKGIDLRACNIRHSIKSSDKFIDCESFG